MGSQTRHFHTPRPILNIGKFRSLSLGYYPVKFPLTRISLPHITRAIYSWCLNYLASFLYLVEIKVNKISVIFSFHFWVIVKSKAGRWNDCFQMVKFASKISEHKKWGNRSAAPSTRRVADFKRLNKLAVTMSKLVLNAKNNLLIENWTFLYVNSIFAV